MTLPLDAFDTEILGIETYKIPPELLSDLSQVESAGSQVQKGMIVGVIPVHTKIITTLERLHFHLVSIRCTHVYRPKDPQKSTPPEGFGISPVVSVHGIEKLDIENLARTIGVQNRYFKDPLIPDEKSLKIYTEWIHNSIENGLASRVFLVYHKSHAVGICTTKIKNKEGIIDLFGIIPEYQQRNLGKALLRQAIEYLESHDVECIHVVTAGENVPANSFFERNNFVIHGVELVYHKHI